MCSQFAVATARRREGDEKHDETGERKRRGRVGERGRGRQRESERREGRRKNAGVREDGDTNCEHVLTIRGQDSGEERGSRERERGGRGRGKHEL